MIVIKRMHAVSAGIAAISLSLFGLSLFGCGSESHTTEVQLPNGVICKSETSGTFLQTNRNMSCIDSTGKVIGSYKND